MEKLNTAWRRLRRGNVSARAIALETQRRIRVALARRGERASLTALNETPAQLTEQFTRLSSPDLLDHFRSRTSPRFFPGFETESLWTAEIISSLFVATLLLPARGIIEHRWPLLGFGEKDFGRDINWHRDPLSGRIWPLDYHANIALWHNDGSDIRALWELNRLGHLVTLGRAYLVSRANESIASGLLGVAVDREFFLQVESWHRQNPLGRGANWACAMEVALRSINLITAFTLFKNSAALNEDRLLLLLKLFDQHGAHIKRNLEYSHIATSNHYLSDLAGLLWLGIMLPELAAAEEWRGWALAELLREMDKQILDDGADYEASTAYHRFILELYFYSFLLCRANEIPIAEKYWTRLHAMFVYLGALGSDSELALIGDSDDSYVWPVPPRNHEGDLLAMGALAFKDPGLLRVGQTTELFWVFGEESRRDEAKLRLQSYKRASHAFPQAGTYVLRDQALALVFNATSPQKGRPTSHRHNDALSVNISAHGAAFIVDPGTYVYTADLRERHLFRSTAYHSTIQIDGEEQQTMREDEPFQIGAEAAVRVLEWKSTERQDKVVAAHAGYERLRKPVTHRRTITFDKVNGWWFIEDELSGSGDHSIAARFHFNAELEVALFGEQAVVAKDPVVGAQLFVCSWAADDALQLSLEPQFVSRKYGSKLPSTTACWSIRASVPYKLRWAIVPVRPEESLEERLELFQSCQESLEFKL